MLAWAVARVVFLEKTAVAAAPSAGRLALAVLGATAIGALVVGGLSWGLATPLFRRLTPLRLVAGTVGAGVYITTMTLIANLGVATGAWSAVNRSSFVLSTGLLSLILGWLVATDPFGLVKSSDRVYLSPAQFAALPAPDQAELVPDASEPQGPKGAA
jgi:HAMP domain-containing protein